MGGIEPGGAALARKGGQNNRKCGKDASRAAQAQASLNQGVLTGLAENRAAFVARDDVAAAAAGILIGDGHAGAI